MKRGEGTCAHPGHGIHNPCRHPDRGGWRRTGEGNDSHSGITLGSGGTVTVDPDTLCTSRQGVFAEEMLSQGPRPRSMPLLQGKRLL